MNINFSRTLEINQFGVIQGVVIQQKQLYLIKKSKPCTTLTSLAPTSSPWPHSSLENQQPSGPWMNKWCLSSSTALFPDNSLFGLFGGSLENPTHLACLYSSNANNFFPGSHLLQTISSNCKHQLPEVVITLGADKITKSLDVKTGAWDLHKGLC